MKKTFKGFLAVMLAIVMVIGLSVTAFAADTYTITVKTSVDNPGTFTAYQIFGGKLDEMEDGSLVLSDVVWGSAIPDADQAAALAAVKALDGFGECESAADIAKVLNDVANTEDPQLAQDFADVIAPFLKNEAGNSGELAKGAESATIEVSAPGYYLVQSSAPADGAEGYAATRYILTVVNDTTVQEKADIPSVSKKVQDINDTADATIGDNAWEDTADHDIGDDVPFQLTGTLPSNFDKYDTYKYVFHDTLSSGLKYNGDVKVYVVNDGVRTELTKDTDYTVSAEGTDITITFDDLKSVSGVTAASSIVVEYTTELTADAIIGNPGNPNEVYLEYSSNPNAGGSGETGTTTTDKVVVFTFELDVNKTHMTDDDTEEPLAGAGFTLSKKGADGVYHPVYFVYNSAKGCYVVTDTPADDAKAEISGEDLTTFKFGGLDDGDYKLEETTVPKGFNAFDPVEFTISASHAQDPQELLLTNVSFTSKRDDVVITAGDGAASGAIGIGSTNILNQKGSMLPSTGGIGTTIFYIVGAVLVVAAGVLLITKLVMNKRTTHQS